MLFSQPPPYLFTHLLLVKGKVQLEWSTIQGVIALVFSNRPRASRSSDFEITRAITP